MLSKFVGETEKNIRDLFADAEQDQRNRGKVLYIVVGLASISCSFACAGSIVTDH